MSLSSEPRVRRGTPAPVAPVFKEPSSPPTSASTSTSLDTDGNEKCPLSLKKFEPSVLGAHVLHNPPDANLEIWLVHGLTGDRRLTWTYKKDSATEAFWPEFLIDDFPSARIVTYGYDSSVVKLSMSWQNSSGASIEDYGVELASTIRSKRQEHSSTDLPIYFIGHSLGGLVIEQALLVCLASKEESKKQIAARTEGVCFMGTPHAGSEVARWGRVLVSLIPRRLWTPNQKILKALKEKSPDCRRLSEKFQRELEDDGKLCHVRTTCFYETVPMKIIGKCVVTKDSAIMHRFDDSTVLQRRPSEPITGDHVTMVQFKSPDDQGYKNVRGQIVAWMESAGSAQRAEGGAAAEANAETSAAASRRDKDGKKKKKTPATTVTAHGPSFHAAVSNSKFYTNNKVAGRDLITGKHAQITNVSRVPRRMPEWSSSSSSEGSGSDDENSDDEDQAGSDGSDSETTLANN